MKTFKRASLPEQINYNGKVYKVDIELSALYSVGRTNKVPNGAIKVEVLSRRLKNRTDIYNRPYKPSIFIFTPIEEKLK